MELITIIKLKGFMMENGHMTNDVVKECFQ